MKKVLYAASTELHLLTFHLPYLEWFKSNNYEVHVAYNGNNLIPFADKTLNISFGRSPFDKNNFKAFKDLKRLIDENDYALIHCHTPMASLVTRLAAIKAKKKGAKVLYTAHGFHFYNKGPLKNWLIFFPIEWMLSFFTNGIITINSEDFNHLKSKRFSSPGKYMINGIGIDPARLNLVEKSEVKALRNELGYLDNQILVLYIAEFIERKNHRFVIDSMPEIIKQCPNIKFIFAGSGRLKNEIEIYSSRLNLSSFIDFIGFRMDVGKFIAISDIGISASKQEGLGLGVAEMMFNGLPVIISEDRGHKELVQNKINGFMFNQGDKKAFINHVVSLYHDKKLRVEIGEIGRVSVKKFLIENSLNQMIKIYEEFNKD